MKGKLRVTEEHSTQSENQPSRLTLYGLAMVGGLGITMMIIAATIGVIGGAELDAASTNLIGLSVVAGLLLLIIANSMCVCNCAAVHRRCSPPIACL